MHFIQVREAAKRQWIQRKGRIQAAGQVNQHSIKILRKEEKLQEQNPNMIAFTIVWQCHKNDK